MRSAVNIFGELAREYRLYRPEYPKGITDAILARIPGERGIYVDLACGSGQLSRKLVSSFERTVATDKSSGQIEQARLERTGVEYLVADATAPLPLPAGSVSLVTVAQALHWFWDERAELWQEVDRLLRPGGVLAVASYGVAELQNPQLQAEFSKFYLGVLGSHLAPGSPGCAWQCDRRLVDCGYAEEAFPYQSTEQRMVVNHPLTMSLGELLAYIRTYSALDTLKPKDPVVDLQAALIKAGGLKGLEDPIEVAFPFRVVTFIK
jgi:SAM-dependent methyltransferase